LHLVGRHLQLYYGARIHERQVYTILGFLRTLSSTMIIMRRIIPMVMKKGCGWKRLWHSYKFLSRNLPGGTEEKHQTGNENNPSPSRDLKPDVWSPRPLRVVWHHHFIHNALRPPCKPYESQHKDNSRNWTTLFL